MKKIVSVILVMLLCLSLCGCAFFKDVADSSIGVEKAKTFEFDGLSIELTTDFLRMEFIDKDYDFIVGDGDITVMGLKAPYEESELKDITALDFAEIYRSASEEVNPTEVTEIDGIPTMQYTVSEDGEDLTVAVMFYKAKDGIWVICFAADSDDFDEDYNEICKYAKSVKFE